MKTFFPITHRQSTILNGFTLIEIMLVVVIVLIAAGVAVPMMSGSSNAAQMRDAVRGTIRTARYARSMAILRQTDCTLSFTTNGISLSGPDGTMAKRRFSEKINITDFENHAQEENRERDEAPGRTVLFYSSGMNEGFDVTFDDEDGRRRIIECNPVTGKVEVEEE